MTFTRLGWSHSEGGRVALPSNSVSYFEGKRMGGDSKRRGHPRHEQKCFCYCVSRSQLIHESSSQQGS